MKLKIALSALLLSASMFVQAQETESDSYEPSLKEISMVCKEDKVCMDIVSDELTDILISGNFRSKPISEFNKELVGYCDDLETPECYYYVEMMKKTYKSAYKEGK